MILPRKWNIKIQQTNDQHTKPLNHRINPLDQRGTSIDLRRTTVPDEKFNHPRNTIHQDH
jgi:hypothetical protein